VYWVGVVTICDDNYCLPVLFFARKHAPAATRITFLAGGRWRHRFLQLFHPETYTAVDASEVPNQGFPYTSLYDFTLSREKAEALSFPPSQLPASASIQAPPSSSSFRMSLLLDRGKFGCKASAWT
jgi:hypothetical protein